MAGRGTDIILGGNPQKNTELVIEQYLSGNENQIVNTLYDRLSENEIIFLENHSFLVTA